MSDLRGFGFVFDAQTGRIRDWYLDDEGVRRFADDNTPVESRSRLRRVAREKGEAVPRFDGEGQGDE